MKKIILILCCIFLGLVSPAFAEENRDPIKIGVIDFYSEWADTVGPYRDGVRLAVEEINQQGGLLGRPLEILFRDDKGDPGEAVRLAEELMIRDEIDVLIGYTFSHVALALTDFVKRNPILYIGTGAADSITLENGHQYNFNFETSSHTLAAITVDLLKDHPGTKLALIAPNYEFGKGFAKVFKDLLAEQRPDLEIVAEQFPPLGKISAGAEAQAISRHKPDIILSALFSSDNAAFVREGRKRGLFENRTVIGLFAGWSEEMQGMGKENPTEWAFVMGYPGNTIDTERHDVFEEKTLSHSQKQTSLGSFYGYSMIQAIKTAVEKTGSLETEQLAKALEDLPFETPIGPITFRGLDHRATFGTWVGQIGYEQDAPVLTNFTYYGGEQYLPSADIVNQRRPQEKGK